MTALDKPWAIQQIDKFFYASDRVTSSSPGVFGVFQRQPDTIVAQHAHVVERILDQVAPGRKASLGGNPQRSEVRTAPRRCCTGKSCT